MKTLCTTGRIGCIGILSCMVVLISVRPVCGAGLELQWAKVANESLITGGDFSVKGTPAPADFGKMEGGDFTVPEGSHAGMVTLWENLGIANENGTNTVFWPLLASDWMLESNAIIDPEGWGAVPPELWEIVGRHLTYSDPGSGPCFFRLSKPESPSP